MTTINGTYTKTDSAPAAITSGALGDIYCNNDSGNLIYFAVYNRRDAVVGMFCYSSGSSKGEWAEENSETLSTGYTSMADYVGTPAPGTWYDLDRYREITVNISGAEESSSSGSSSSSSSSSGTGPAQLVSNVAIRQTTSAMGCFDTGITPSGSSDLYSIETSACFIGNASESARELYGWSGSCYAELNSSLYYNIGTASGSTDIRGDGSPCALSAAINLGSSGRHALTITKGGVSQTLTRSSTATAGLTLQLFKCNGGSTFGWFGSFYVEYFRVRRNGTLILDWVPAKDANGTVCFWDYVTSGYAYATSGVTPFVYGDESSSSEASSSSGGGGAGYVFSGTTGGAAVISNKAFTLASMVPPCIQEAFPLGDVYMSEMTDAGRYYCYVTSAGPENRFLKVADSANNILFCSYSFIDDATTDLASAYAQWPNKFEQNCWNYEDATNYWDAYGLGVVYAASLAHRT